MLMHRDFDPGDTFIWRSLSETAEHSGYRMREKSDRFSAETIAEAALVATGAVAILAAYLLWFLPVGGGITKSFASALSIGLGLGLFAFGTRGFRRELRLDKGAGVLHLARLNGWNHARVRRTIALGRIESLFVQRSGERGAPAELRLRIKGMPGSIALLRGSRGDLETLHRRLTRDIRLVLAPSARPAGDIRAPRLFSTVAAAA